jgi:hypothetical protein
VSVHGATVLYRRERLVDALKVLAGEVWLNDDVAVPLTLRLRNPGMRLAYMTGSERGGSEAPGWVSDVGVRSEMDVEYRRRRRMVIGNLQWIRGLLLPRFFERPLVSLVALRRVFRVFWAYSVLLVLLGLGMGVAQVARMLPTWSIVLPLLAVGIEFLMSNWVRRLSMAFLSGLQVPLYWKELGKRRTVSWV